MKQVINLIFSTKMTILLLLIFAVAMGAATFIEDKYDTVTAKLIIYNAKWFEFVLLLLALNFIVNIKKYNLFRKEKAAVLLFHIAFIVMIIGAGITRYTSFEGSMHIREGESSNIIYISKPYLQIFAADNSQEYTYDIPIYLSEITDNSFHLSIDSEEKGTIDIDYHDYIKNAIEKIEENVEGGVNIIELSVFRNNNREMVFLKDGEIKDIGIIAIGYNNNEREHAIKVTEKEGKLYIISPHDIRRTKMAEMKTDTILKDSIAEFKEKYVYNTQGVMFSYTKLFKNAKERLVRGEPDDKGVDALIVDVTFNGKKHEVPVFGGSGYIAKYQEAALDGITLKMAYGEKPIELPFSIYLDDFILDRYAGSNSPSSFASEVILIDERNGLRQEHRIFMNNVLDYDGYRFFQSSYDKDEKGTVLSVNHDFYGTWVSYFGYFLLGIGFIITLLNKNSHFSALRRNIRKIRIKRKKGVMAIVLIFGLNGFAYSQSNNQNPVSTGHVEKFGNLIVQGYDGRFEPLHSLAYDVMRKISKKDKFDTEEKGEMDGMQVFMDMFLDPEFWKQQKIIYIREKSVRDIIGTDGKYASFNDFFDQHSSYRLAEFSENAFRKKKSEQNKFDKEIIKVDERVNICMMVFQGNLLKIFPEQGSLNNKWISWDEKPAFTPLTGSIKILNEDLQLEVLNYSNILRLYLTEVLEATKSGSYSRADKILGYIESIQRNSTAAEILPTQSMVNFEIRYNKSQIFIKLKNWYALLSLILLILAFIDNLRTKKSKIIRLMLNFFILLLGIAFVYHTYGMGLRWYLTGHAPWSNGYEALILIAWGGLLAGFSFIRYSKITLAATALLAFFVLMTAGHSSYDPQLTNLQPVLQSYWLIIHVAVIVIGYGFLGLGFVLGLINLFVYLFKTHKNSARLDLIIKELTYINEMNLTIGIVLATIGTFLGAIWANESWGRYWGWDAKETWALVIIITYAMILHFRLVPKLKGAFIFNAGSVIGFGSVIMTFIGVNYYLSKGLHSYAAGDTPVFPVWAWGMILSLIILVIVAGVKEKLLKKQIDS